MAIFLSCYWAYDCDANLRSVSRGLVVFHHQPGLPFTFVQYRTEREPLLDLNVLPPLNPRFSKRSEGKVALLFHVRPDRLGRRYFAFRSAGPLIFYDVSSMAISVEPELQFVRY
jgi:hypothetical protein